MDAFWGITITLLLLRAAWKGGWLKPNPRVKKGRRNTVKNRKATRRVTDEEMVTVILPTINNGQ